MARNFDIGFSFSWSPILLIFSVVLAVGYVLWVYRRTLPPVSGFFYYLLIVSRSLSLLLLCLVLFGSVLRFTWQKTRPPVLGLLMDVSRSMGIEENGRVRGSILQEILHSPELEILKKRTTLESYLFSDRLIPLKTLDSDSLFFTGTATDLAQALKSLSERRRGIPLSGVLVLSDGAHNMGEDPIHVGETLSFPVYAVTIGESRQKPDLVLGQILTNEITYVGNRVPVEIAVRGPGFAGKHAWVRLKAEGEILDEAEVLVPDDGLETSVRLYFTPSQPGFFRMSCEITRMEGEFTFENNFREMYTKVLKSKLSVLLLAGSPSPDFAFVKRILEADENLKVITRTEKRNAGFYEGPFPSDDILQSIDVLLLLDMPCPDTPLSIGQKITELLGKRRVPFLLIAGKQTDFQKLESAKELLPFDLPQKSMESYVLLKLTSEGETHPALRICEEREENQTVWHQLPPIFSSWSLIEPKSGSQILATGVPEKLSGSFEEKGVPMVFSLQANGGKSLVFLGHGLYRWDLLMRGTGSTHEVLKGFLENAVRWLATHEEGKTVRISTDKRVYRAGEDIFLSAQVYSETYQPVEGALVTLTVTSPSGEFPIQLEDVGGGRYKKTFRVFESGMYALIGEALFQRRSLGKDKTEFSVSSFNPEFLDTRANPELMKSLAWTTGGKSGPPDSLASLINAMHFSPHVLHFSREIELYDSPWVLAAIVFFLSLEWLIRKRMGMV